MDAPITPEVIIKFLQIVLIVSLLFPVNVKAQQIETQKTIYYDPLSPENTLYRPSDEVVEKLAASYAQAQLKRTHYDGNLCSCVLYLEGQYGFNPGVIHYARNWPLNAKIGSVGGVVVLNEGGYGHVAEIAELSVSGYVLDEANYSSCRHTYGRILPYDSPDIKGFWNP